MAVTDIHKSRKEKGAGEGGLDSAEVQRRAGAFKEVSGRKKSDLDLRRGKDLLQAQWRIKSSLVGDLS